MRVIRLNEKQAKLKDLVIGDIFEDHNNYYLIIPQGYLNLQNIQLYKMEDFHQTDTVVYYKDSEVLLK